MLLEDVLKEYIYDIKSKNYSEKTIRGYKNNNLAFFRYIAMEFEIEELEEVKPIHIKSYFMYLKGIGRKATYTNGILKSVRSLFVYCVKEGYILEKNNPATKVSWMKQDKPLIQTFSDEEISKMINAYKTNSWMNMRNKLIILFFVDTGIRASELINIHHHDVLDTNIKISGKGRKERYVPISPILKKNIIKYERMKIDYFKDKLLTHSNYFVSYRCQPLTNEALIRVVKIAGERANVRSHIRCSPHTIRHYFAQKQLQMGLDVYSLSRLMGHNSINTTKIYLESLQDEQIVEIGRMNSPLMNLGKSKK